MLRSNADDSDKKKAVFQSHRFDTNPIKFPHTGNGLSAGRQDISMRKKHDVSAVALPHDHQTSKLEGSTNGHAHCVRALLSSFPPNAMFRR